LKSLDQITLITTDVMAIYEVLWAASSIDLTAERVDFQQDYRKILHECKRRIYQLEIMNKNLPKRVVALETYEVFGKKLSYVNELLVKLRQNPNSFAPVHQGIQEM
jgi:hypothetical protein